MTLCGRSFIGTVCFWFSSCYLWCHTVSPALLWGVYCMQCGPALMPLAEHCIFPIVTFCKQHLRYSSVHTNEKTTAVSKCIQTHRERGVAFCSAKGLLSLNKNYDSENDGFHFLSHGWLVFLFSYFSPAFWQAPFQGPLTIAQPPLDANTQGEIKLHKLWLPKVRGAAMVLGSSW